jgi:hypothetical protein
MVIEILRQEHRNIEKLLQVLERELNVFARRATRSSTRFSLISRSIPMSTTTRWRTWYSIS